MNTLWTYIDGKDWSLDAKSAAIILISGAVSALGGLILWLIIRPWTLSTLDWMACFMGYPVFISWYAAFLYSCTHELQNNGYVSSSSLL